jgi:hypothetical protein
VSRQLDHHHINLLSWIIAKMENIKTSQCREQFCVNFDESLKRKKELYRKATGKEWEGDGE